jgi:hypothetical protein
MISSKSVLAALVALSFSVSKAPAQVNLITNGGFEGGVYSSTLFLNLTNSFVTNDIVPNGWAPSPGFDWLPAFNGVTSFNPHSGAHALFIGNNVGDPLATLSQTFSDAPGQTYSATFYLGNTHTTGFFQALIDGNVQLTVQIPPGNQNQLDYGLKTFTFLGTGSDTLTFQAANNNASYLVDDVSVGLANSVPEPSTWLMLLAGFLALGFFRGYRILNATIIDGTMNSVECT